MIYCLTQPPRLSVIGGFHFIVTDLLYGLTFVIVGCPGLDVVVLTWLKFSLIFSSFDSLQYLNK